MIHPEEGDYRKTNKIGETVWELLNQVGGQLAIGGPRKLWNLQIQYEQGESNRIYAVRDGAQPVM